MNILVIDGQGGGLGRQIIAEIRKQWPDMEVMAVGTNSIATSAMLKAGASAGATGENAVIHNCKTADIILGPLGIAMSNAMHGEISAHMANAVSESKALKLLVPVSKCNAHIVGMAERPMSQHLSELMAELRAVVSDNKMPIYQL